jgi:hypothetical protein
MIIKVMRACAYRIIVVNIVIVIIVTICMHVVVVVVMMNILSCINVVVIVARWISEKYCFEFLIHSLLHNGI